MSTEIDFEPNPMAGVTETRRPINVPSAPRVPRSIGSTGMVNSQVIKSTPGTLFGVSGVSMAGVDQTIMIFDLAAVPANGAVPKFRVPAFASLPFGFNFDVRGSNMQTGIVVCKSTTVDTLTLGAADTYWTVTFDGQELNSNG